MRYIMKKLLIIVSLLQISFIVPMQPNYAEHIKQKIGQLEHEGASAEEIAQLSTDALRQMLEYPLIHISCAQYIDLYKALSDAGGDKNVKHPKNGKTALIFAALDGRPDIVKELFELGVDFHIADDRGNTVKDLLNSGITLFNSSSKNEIERLLREAEIASIAHKSKIT